MLKEIILKYSNERTTHSFLVFRNVVSVLKKQYKVHLFGYDLNYI